MSVLLVNGSPRGPRSESLTVATVVAAALDPQHDRIDCFDPEQLPPFGIHETDAKLAVVGGREVALEDRAAWQQVLATAERVRHADTLVFAAPMWNGGVPWALKLFVDTVNQPKVAFRFDPATGYHGLLGGRNAVIATTSSIYQPHLPPAYGSDHCVPYLTYWLNFVGITEIDVLELRPTRPGPELEVRREAVLEQASALAARLSST